MQRASAPAIRTVQAPPPTAMTPSAPRVSAPAPSAAPIAQQKPAGGIFSWLSRTLFGSPTTLNGYAFGQAEADTQTNILIPIAAFFTAISISFLFLSLGFGYEGTIAGLGASLSQSIYVRTSIGRVDTDLLNIGFFYLILSLIFSSIRISHHVNKLIFISLAGITNFCFIWWYQRPGFFIVFLFSLIILQIFYKKNLKESLLQIFIFSLFSGPYYVFESFDNIINYINLYLNFAVNETHNTGLLFPDTFKTITELQKLDFFEYSKIVFGENKEWIVLMGILGFIIFICFNFNKSLILITPVTFLLMSVFIGKRFAIYAIPLYWFGVAYLLICSVFFINKILEFPKLLNISQNFYKTLVNPGEMVGILTAQSIG